MPAKNLSKVLYFRKSYGTEICDYAISNISNDNKVTKSGVFDDSKEMKKAELVKDENGNQVFVSTVEIQRLGDMILPIEVLIKFEDGTEVLEKWKGEETYKTFTYEKTTKVECAEIDPEQKLFLDKNFLNNSFTSKPNPSGIRKYVNEFMFWMQNAMEGLNLFI